MNNTPTLHKIIRARHNIYSYFKPTPLFHCLTLGKQARTDIWIKQKNHQPAGDAFLTAAIQLLDRLVHKKVMLFISGGNIAPKRLKYIIQEFGS